MSDAPNVVYYYEYKPHDGDFWIKTATLKEPKPSDVFEDPDRHVRNIKEYEPKDDD